MPLITTSDLTNAKADVDTIAAVANSNAYTVIDRLGNSKMTLKGMEVSNSQDIAEMLAEARIEIDTTAGGITAQASAAASAAAGSSGSAAASAAAALAAQTAAQAAASGTAVAKIFNTKALANAGVGAMTNGQYAEVIADESRSGSPRTRYEVVSGSLVFRLDLNAAVLASLVQPEGGTRVGFQRDGSSAAALTVTAALQGIASIPATWSTGAAPDGIVDSRLRIFTAMSAAATIVGTTYGPIAVDLGGLEWGIGSRIYLPRGVYLKNGSLKAVGAWAAGDPMVTINGNENSGLMDVQIDCDFKCAGLLRRDAGRSHVDNCRIQRFKTYGVWDTDKTQECTLTNSRISQFVFGDEGFEIAANRDAPCLWVDTADSLYSNLVMAYGSYPLLVTGPLNQFSNIHAYNGATDDGTNNVAVRIDGTGGYVAGNNFENIYVDNGLLQIIDDFRQNLSNIHFERNAAANTTKGLELITAVAGETGAGLNISNVRFTGNFPAGLVVYSTTGVGTWAASKQINWQGAQTASGVVAGPYSQWLDQGIYDGSGRLVLGRAASATIFSTASRLQLLGSSAAGASMSILNYANDTTPAGLFFAKSRGAAIGTYSGILSGDILARINAGGDDGTAGNYNASGARVDFRAAIDWTGARRDTDIVFATTATNSITDRWVIEAGGRLRPAVDNAVPFGSASFRATALFAASGTINTSDAREKTARGVLTEAELRAWAKVRPLVFQFNDAIVEKGTAGARLHAGYMAQEVQAAFASEGLEATKYALWCSDPLTAPVKRTKVARVQRTELVEVVESFVEVINGRATAVTRTSQTPSPVTEMLPVYSEDGAPLFDVDGKPRLHEHPVMDEVLEEYEVQEPTGEYRLGLRYDQCLVFETAYLRSLLEALTAMSPLTPLS